MNKIWNWLNGLFGTFQPQRERSISMAREIESTSQEVPENDHAIEKANFDGWCDGFAEAINQCEKQIKLEREAFAVMAENANFLSKASGMEMAKAIRAKEFEFIAKLTPPAQPENYTLGCYRVTNCGVPLQRCKNVLVKS